MHIAVDYLILFETKKVLDNQLLIAFCWYITLTVEELVVAD